MKNIILASKSPRRAELLSMMGYEFVSVSTDIDEEAILTGSPSEAVQLIASAKAEGAAEICGRDSIIISADTVVELDGRVLGKPADVSSARNMLKLLSDKSHFVHTGLCVLNKGSRFYCGTSSARVTFRKIEEDELNFYIASGEPFDKAGAYGIQERGAVFAQSVEGDFYAVVGLPVCTLSVVLTRLACLHAFRRTNPAWSASAVLV